MTSFVDALRLVFFFSLDGAFLDARLRIRWTVRPLLRPITESPTVGVPMIAASHAHPCEWALCYAKVELHHLVLYHHPQDSDNINSSPTHPAAVIFAQKILTLLSKACTPPFKGGVLKCDIEVRSTWAFGVLDF